MGEVRANVTLKNYGGVWATEKGFIPHSEIKKTNLDMLVDTGAVLMYLPEDEVEKLELKPSKKIEVTYADERKEERWVASGIEITIKNRSMVTDCVICPPLCEPLLGQIVLEELDLPVDSAKKKLTPRPKSPNLPLLKLK